VLSNSANNGCGHLKNDSLINSNINSGYIFTETFFDILLIYKILMGSLIVAYIINIFVMHRLSSADKMITNPIFRRDLKLPKSRTNYKTSK